MTTLHPIADAPEGPISDLLDFRYTLRSVVAVFALANPDRSTLALEVRFDFVDATHACIVRLIDDFAMSTEEGNWPRDGGGIKGQYAYEVDGGPFWRSQSEVWLKQLVNPKHYQFIPYGMCLEIITPSTPRLNLISMTDEWANALG